MRNPHPLDVATALEATGPGRLQGQTRADYGNMTGFFGGYVTACLLRAVLEQPRLQDVPIAMTVNFCAPLAEGRFDASVREVRTGRSTQHWLAEISQSNGTAATASIVCGAHRAVWSRQTARIPSAPPYESVPVHAPFARSGWFQQYEMRFIEGAPDFSSPNGDAERSARSTLWLRDAGERPLDHLSLSAMADAFVIRAFVARGKLVPASTVTMTTYFHGTREEIAAQGTRPLLCTADANIFKDGFADQTAHLWGRDGRLLATSNQIVWYKE